MRRNIVIVGSTGAGKSRTCNTLFNTQHGPLEPFLVAHDEVSSTKAIVQHFCKSKNLNIIDTPSFGHTKMNDKQITDKLLQLSSIITNPNSKDHQQIDAFVLVVRLTPRAQTLKSDLEHLKHVFGRAGIKSTIILPIYSGKRGNEGNFLEKLEKMQEVVKILKEQKQEEPSEGWYCLWDNVNPREGQEEELLKKIGKLIPYTQNDLMKAKDQHSFYNELELKDKYGKREKESRGIQKICGEGDLKDELFSSSEVEETLNKVLEVIESRQKSYQHKIKDVMKKNDEMLDKFMSRVEELEKKDKEKEKKKELSGLVQDIVCRKRKLQDEEKQELVGATITDGTKETAKKTAESAGKKVGEKIGQQGAKQLKKEGNRVIKEILH